MISRFAFLFFSRFTFVFVGVSLAQLSWAQKGASDPAPQGYIIRKTKDGIIKIPKGQTFRFGGSDVQAGVDRPGQSVLGRRPQPMRSTLIPARASFRNETLRDVGYVGGN